MKMGSAIWNGKEFLDLIQMDPLCVRILSCVIENSIIEENLFVREKNDAKVIRILNRFQKIEILERMESPVGPILALSSNCYLPSWRSALGTTPGRRSHRFPEEKIRDFSMMNPRTCCCALARGRFLMEWRAGQWEKLVGSSERSCKIWIPEDGACYGAIRIGFSKMEKQGNQWIVFDPQKDRNREEEEKREIWTWQREAEDQVILFREENDGSWENFLVKPGKMLQFNNCKTDINRKSRE